MIYLTHDFRRPRECCAHYYQACRLTSLCTTCPSALNASIATTHDRTHVASGWREYTCACENWPASCRVLVRPAGGMVLMSFWSWLMIWSGVIGRLAESLCCGPANWQPYLFCFKLPIRNSQMLETSSRILARNSSEFSKSLKFSPH